jgi:hypothetical protein
MAIGKAVHSVFAEDTLPPPPPGPVTPGEHEGGYGDHSAVQPGTTLRQPEGTSPANTLAADDPAADSMLAGGLAPADTGWPSHKAAIMPWDSNSGPPGASGPVGPDNVHAIPRGLKPAASPAQIGVPPDHVLTTPSGAPAFSWDASTGMRQHEVIGRVAQDEFHGAGSQINYRPRWFDVMLRPFRNNTAATATPLNPVANEYGVQGATPDIVRQASDTSVAYQAPPDPAVRDSTATGGQQWSQSIPGVL